MFYGKNVRFSNGTPNHLKTQTKKCPKSQMFRFQVISILMVAVTDMSGIQMVVTHQDVKWSGFQMSLHGNGSHLVFLPFKNRTLVCLVFK